MTGGVAALVLFIILTTFWFHILYQIPKLFDLSKRITTLVAVKQRKKFEMFFFLLYPSELENGISGMTRLLRNFVFFGAMLFCIVRVPLVVCSFLGDPVHNSS